MYISERNWKIRQKISEECKSFRKTLGITELEVAKMTGNSLSSVHLFEQGKKDSGTIRILQTDSNYIIQTL